MTCVTRLRLDSASSILGDLPNDDSARFFFLFFIRAVESPGLVILQSLLHFFRECADLLGDFRRGSWGSSVFFWRGDLSDRPLLMSHGKEAYCTGCDSNLYVFFPPLIVFLEAQWTTFCLKTCSTRSQSPRCDLEELNFFFFSRGNALYDWSTLFPKPNSVRLPHVPRNKVVFEFADSVFFFMYTGMALSQPPLLAAPFLLLRFFGTL